MTDDDREALRDRLERLLRWASMPTAFPVPAVVDDCHVAASSYLSLAAGVVIPIDPDTGTPDTEAPPPLPPAKVLALNVLLGDPATLEQALGDYLLDLGHEYTTAVAVQAAERAADLCDGMAEACRVGAITSEDSRCRMQAYRHAAESIRKTARPAVPDRQEYHREAAE